MDKNEIKRIIETYEYYNNGMKHINGSDAEAINIRIRKEKIIADIKLHYYDDNKTETYRNCEYPKTLFKEE